MKKNIFIELIFALMILTIGLPVMAEDGALVTSYGPKSKRFGAGLYLGDPVGVTLKGYLTKRFAINGVAAWTFVDKAFTAIGDLTFDFFDIPIDSSVATFPFYAGAGAKVEVKAKPNDKTNVGIRVPVGVAVQWNNYPVEVFLEVAPGIKVAPATEFDISGGIGVRYYF